MESSKHHRLGRESGVVRPVVSDCLFVLTSSRLKTIQDRLGGLFLLVEGREKLLYPVNSLVFVDPSSRPGTVGLPTFVTVGLSGILIDLTW